MSTTEQIFQHVLNPMTELFVAPRQMGETEQASALAQYCDVLRGFSEGALTRGWEQMRASHLFRSWPTPAALSKACAAAESTLVRKRAQHEQGRMVNGEWQPWGGACQCDRCVYKIPNEGFYKAPRADYERDAATRRELDDWMHNRMYGPGTPPVPEFTHEELHISPAKARAVIEATYKRLKYDPDEHRGPDTPPRRSRPLSADQLEMLRKKREDFMRKHGGNHDDQER